MRIPKSITDVIDSLQKLPGIGPKTAQRLAFYLLHVPQRELDSFAESLSNLKKYTVLCSICKNVSEKDPCPVCSDTSRDASTILVVEQPLDIVAFERTGRYGGLYHVLHGAISPLDNIGPDEIYIKELFYRLSNGHSEPPRRRLGGTIEIIIATNPNMEGEATAMYIAKELRTKSEKLKVGTNESGTLRVNDSGELKIKNYKLKISRLGMGIPTGADIEYADETTLTQAIEGRRAI